MNMNHLFFINNTTFKILMFHFFQIFRGMTPDALIQRMVVSTRTRTMRNTALKSKDAMRPSKYATKYVVVVYYETIVAIRH